MEIQSRKIRVLGLHGMGTSAAIFRSQTAAMRLKLPPDRFEFVFVDAPHPCSAAPGTDVLFDSARHYAFWTDPAAPPEAIRSAIAWLDGQLAQHGPFDILMGFSQGCALIASYLVHHSLRSKQQRLEVQDQKPLPFKAAVFICGGVPLQVLSDAGVEVTRRARDINALTGRMLRGRTAALAEMAANPELVARERGVGLWDRDGAPAGLVHDPGRMPDQRDVFGLDLSDEALPDGVGIAIPTAHVFGAKDPRWPASIQLACLCRDKRMYDHGGGHEIPRTTEVSEAMAELMMGLAKGVQGE
ncbi:hypothetical protein VTJ83DRAFT_5003 [Remersonia thermophila]|uniref:Serine hydrolase domain-containing protein n=1 Tax=Remersonia thermophila TaxID=72144 RepID=A0ABR4DD22_9PEZI